MDHQRGAAAADEALLGQHIVSVEHDAGSQFDLVAPMFRAGLESDCQCVYVSDRTPPPAVVARLQERGCDIERAVKTGQFVLATSRELHVRDGCFDADRMLEAVADAVQGARNTGFRGWCGVGELSWVARRVPGTERLLDYEFRLNYVSGLERAAIVCLYDKSTIPAWLEPELDKTHPLTHTNGQVTPSETYVADMAYAAELPLAQELEPPADSLPCQWLAELVSGHADGELIPRRGQEVAAHVAACPVCRAWTHAVRELKQGLRGLKTPAPVPDGFWEAVRSRLRSPQDSE